MAILRLIINIGIAWLPRNIVASVQQFSVATSSSRGRQASRCKVSQLYPMAPALAMFVLEFTRINQDDYTQVSPQMSWPER